MEKKDNGQLSLKISEIIKELNSFDFNRSLLLLQSDTFQTQKLGLLLATFDKPFYNKQDLNNFQTIQDYVKKTFPERGTRTTKKQLLSSKEKEVWNCECEKPNDIGAYCSGCFKDIYRFKSNEIAPATVEKYINQKFELITEFIE